MMVNTEGQLDRIYNYIGDKPLARPVKDYLDSVNEVGSPILNVDCYSMGWDSALHTKEKANRVSAFIYLLPECRRGYLPTTCLILLLRRTRLSNHVTVNFSFLKSLLVKYYVAATRKVTNRKMSLIFNMISYNP